MLQLLNSWFFRWFSLIAWLKVLVMQCRVWWIRPLLAWWYAEAFSISPGREILASNHPSGYDTLQLPKPKVVHQPVNYNYPDFLQLCIAETTNDTNILSQLFSVASCYPITGMVTKVSWNVAIICKASVEEVTWMKFVSRNFSNIYGFFTKTGEHRYNRVEVWWMSIMFCSADSKEQSSVSGSHAFLLSIISSSTFLSTDCWTMVPFIIFLSWENLHY